VAVFTVAALIVAALLLGSGHHQQGPGGSGVTSIPIASVAVWIPPTQQTPDHPGEAQYSIDGNPKTQWLSDQYPSSNFEPYGGEGLVLHLSSSTTMHQLQVSSYTQGWAASTYIADSEPTTLAGWGSATDSRTNIAGNATFNLGGRQGTWVLFYMTNTGRTGNYNQIAIQELSLS